MGERQGGIKRRTEGGRRGTVAFVRSLISLMVLKALAGKQMLFCEMDSIFFSLHSLQVAAGIKSTSNMRITGGRVGGINMDALEVQTTDP